MSTKPEAKTVQRLPTLEAVECHNCHRRVHFATRTSRPASDPRFRMVYLNCPVCGAAATRLVEVANVRKRTRYVYEG